ncbi:MAG: hypothetical protein ACRCX2_04805, partial [Paraclostridium sp.]
MSNSIYDSYDFTANTLAANDERDNVLQDALVRLLQACGFDLTRNANVFISLAASLTKTPDQILADLKAAGEKNQVITIDKANGRLVLIDPLGNGGAGVVKQLEALSNTFNQIILGTQQFTPSSSTNYSIRVIPVSGTNPYVTLGITDSSGAEHIVATKTTTDSLKAEITALQTVTAQHTTDIAQLKTTTGQHTT